MILSTGGLEVTTPADFKHHVATIEYLTAENLKWESVNAQLNEENQRLTLKLSEAWHLVNVMAGQEPWLRAEQWLEENKDHAPTGAKRL